MPGNERSANLGRKKRKEAADVCPDCKIWLVCQSKDGWEKDWGVYECVSCHMVYLQIYTTNDTYMAQSGTIIPAKIIQHRVPADCLLRTKQWSRNAQPSAPGISQCATCVKKGVLAKEKQKKEVSRQRRRRRKCPNKAPIR